MITVPNNHNSLGRHYERAFTALLKKQRTAYVALDQTHKAMIHGARLKSFDFIIYPAGAKSAQAPLLVELKGRKLPWKRYCKGHWGPTWAPRADIEGLSQWEPVFGSNCQAVLIFAYWLFDAPVKAAVLPHITSCNEKSYVFAALPVSSYQLKMRNRSRKWQTVYIPQRTFNLLAVPYNEFAS